MHVFVVVSGPGHRAAGKLQSPVAGGTDDWGGGPGGPCGLRRTLVVPGEWGAEACVCDGEACERASVGAVGGT